MLKLFIKCLKAQYQKAGAGGDYAVERQGDTLRLLFEKSDGLKDWRNNFHFPIKPYKHMGQKWYCHRGFLKVWKAIEPYVVEHIMDPRVKKIEIIGYSHGAAIALLCYEYCIFNRPDAEVRGVGFGCPRVFWGTVPKEVKSRFDNFVVVRNGRDIVTHVPPALLGYRHISKILQIGEDDSRGIVKDHTPVEYIRHLSDKQ